MQPDLSFRIARIVGRGATICGTKGSKSSNRLLSAPSTDHPQACHSEKVLLKAQVAVNDALKTSNSAFLASLSSFPFLIPGPRTTCGTVFGHRTCQVARLTGAERIRRAGSSRWRRRRGDFRRKRPNAALTCSGRQRLGKSPNGNPPSECARFQIVEQRQHRHASPRENGSAAHHVWRGFDRFHLAGLRPTRFTAWSKRARRLRRPVAKDRLRARCRATSSSVSASVNDGVSECVRGKAAIALGPR